MTEGITHTLKWKYFNHNVTSRVLGVINEQSFSDVTLVSDDQKPFLAHKYILSTVSPVLKNILLNNPHSHPLIYLRGVNHQVLDTILQFIYFGKALVDPRNVNRLYQAAEDLQIKKLGENIRMEYPSGPRREDLDNNDHILSEDINEDNQTKNGYNRRSASYIADQTLNNYIPARDEHGSNKKLHKCEECEAIYKSQSSLWRHASSKHKGNYYSCKYCGYKATRQSHRKTHQESIHEGIKYSCEYCGFKASQQSNIKRHQDSVHKGVKFSCDKCDNHFTLQDSLKTHIKSVHEGVKYSCNQCDYQATQQRHLKSHKKSVHEGVKYVCDQCNYQTGRKHDLKTHKQRMHLLL